MFNVKNKYENEIRIFFIDKINRLWIVLKVGKLKVYQDNQELKNLFLNYKMEDIGFIYIIIGDVKGNIWLGIKGKGLYKVIFVNV